MSRVKPAVLLDAQWRAWLRPRRQMLCAAVAAIGLLLPSASRANEALALIETTWGRYRSVGSEREEIEFLLVPSPPQALFTAGAAESLAANLGAGVVRKRAIRHMVYAVDRRDRIHVLFSEPSEDAGLGLLVWRQVGTPDDLWSFLPGYRNVRRLPASSSVRLAGTDFIYEDVRDFSGERTEAWDYSLLGEDEVDGRRCTVVGAQPKGDASTSYGRRKICIDRERSFPMKIEFYNRDGEIWKVLHNSSLREVAPGVHRADLSEMRDIAGKRSTVVLIRSRRTGLSIPDAVFTKDYLVHPGND